MNRAEPVPELPWRGGEKWSELVAIALAAGERDEARMRGHVDQALRAGATSHEIVSVLRVALVLYGVPSLRSGLRVLLAALAERGELR